MNICGSCGACDDCGKYPCQGDKDPSLCVNEEREKYKLAVALLREARYWLQDVSAYVQDGESDVFDERVNALLKRACDEDGL